jgi:hypothetical protein
MKDLFGQDLHTQPEIVGEEYYGTLVKWSGAAILFDDGTQQVWLPLSQIRYANADTRVEGCRSIGHTIVVTIPDWLAKKKGLIE